MAARLGVPALIAAVLVGCGSHAPLRPPRISETFTRLPCRRAGMSTLNAEGCAEAQIVASDRAIDIDVATVFGHLPHDARKSFVESERSWLAYRRASCTAESARYAGGTLEPVAFAQCLAERNERHLRDLLSMRDALRP